MPSIDRLQLYNYGPVTAESGSMMLIYILTISGLSGNDKVIMGYEFLAMLLHLPDKIKLPLID